MRLFHRVLLSFVGVIALQGVLTISLVSGSVERSQAVDAKRELQSEASTAYDNFNAWKRRLWKELLLLREDRELSSLIASQRSIGFDEALEDYLRSVALRTGADFLLVRSTVSAYTAVYPLSAEALPSPPAKAFSNRKSHPYIDTVLLDGSLYFVGTVSLGQVGGPTLDAFLVKGIDPGLCAQLTFNPRIQTIIAADSSFAVGTVDASSFFAWLGEGSLSGAYANIDGIEQGGTPYSGILQLSGTARVAGEEGKELPLYVVTLFSRSEYRARLSSINRILLTVSALIAAFTILISLGLSTGITAPIRRLRDAMTEVVAGRFDVAVRGPARGEMEELRRGFNEMAAHLARDREALDAYVVETVRLKEYMEKVFDSMREGLMVVNEVFAVEKANRAFLEGFGLDKDAVLGRNIDELSIDLFDASLHASVRAVVSGGLPYDFQTRRSPDGSTYELKFYALMDDPGLSSGRALRGRVHCILIIEDVSRRIAYEEGIFQAEKLAGISMLSAGVAHEINNPLSSILTNVQNLIASTEQDSPASEDLRIIEAETRRIGRIVRQLLDFSQAHREGRSSTDVNGSVTETIQLLRYSVKKESHVTVEAELGEALADAAVEPDEFKQVLINLLRNSLQATGSGGTITVRTGLSEGGEAVELVVRDTGCGIPKEARSRIFDPFFTTKGTKGNTGLGLSVVYGIVKKYGGSVSVESEEGSGTTMRVTFPAQRE